jgi:hypothetical protein
MRGLVGGIPDGGKISILSGDSRNFIDDGSDHGSIWKDISDVAGESAKPL